MSSSRRTYWLAMLGSLYLTACGQKGPLYLQTPEEMARQQAQEQQAQQAEQAKSKK